MSTDIRVALVYQQESGTVALRSALANAGVEIAIECKADSLTGSAILSQDVDAVVVNLDPELEDLLDEVTDALDGATQPVIYNDPAASSDLSGWDRARWMRHLSAKLKGRSDVTPPAPAGSQAIPSPVKKFVPILVPVAASPIVANGNALTPAAAIADTQTFVPAESISAEAANAAEISASMVLESPTAQTPQVSGAPSELGDSQNFADIEGFFDEIPSFGSVDEKQSQTLSTASASTEIGEFSFDNLILPETVELAMPDVVRAPAAPSVDSSEPDDYSLDALFTDSSSFEMPVAQPLEEAEVGASDFSLDDLFEPESGSLASSESSAAADFHDDGLADLDALFREFEPSQSAQPSADISAPEAATASKKSFEAKSAPLDWSLEPVASEAESSPEIAAIFEWRLDGAAPPIPQKTLPIESMPAPKQSTPQLPADLEASLALADLKLLDDDFSFDLPVTEKEKAPDASRANDGFMDLGSSLSLLDDSADVSPEATTDHSLALAELDFALDLGDLNGVDAPMNGVDANADFSAGLDDLDSLFEPMSTPPVMGLALSDLNRVYVLGASIGGPESIKAFLSKLPASVPAAFIIAQHMGAEFLEMMAVQLDAASQLSVRCPKSGERLRHGEVLVAPVGEQLLIDDTGVVRLSAANSNSPYSPSIDQLIHDAADRFGDHATLILFSGMGTDSIEGGRYLTGRGGEVWAQDRASCVIASMIDAAKAQGLVTFEGSPDKLAARVAGLAQ